MSQSRKNGKFGLTNRGLDIEYDNYKEDVMKERSTIESLKNNFVSFEQNFGGVCESLKNLVDQFPKSYSAKDGIHKFIPKVRNEIIEYDNYFEQYKSTARGHQLKMSKRLKRFEGVDEIFSIREVEKKKYDRAYRNIRSLFDKMHQVDPNKLTREMESLKHTNNEYNDTLTETKKYLVKIIEDGFPFYDRLFCEMYTDILHLFLTLQEKFKGMENIGKEIVKNKESFKIERPKFKNTQISLDFDVDTYNPGSGGVASLLSSTSEVEEIEFPPNMPEEKEEEEERQIFDLRDRKRSDSLKQTRNMSQRQTSNVSPSNSIGSRNRRNLYGQNSGGGGGGSSSMGRGKRLAGFNRQPADQNRGGQGRGRQNFVAPPYRSVGGGRGGGNIRGAPSRNQSPMDPAFKKFLSKEYWYQNESAEQIGPVNWKELKKRFKTGRIKREWWIFATDFDDWVELDSQSKLIQCLNSRF